MICDPEGRELPPAKTARCGCGRRESTDVPLHRRRGADREGGWESLGDVGWLDADNYLYLGDRREDMTLTGGANVYPAEVEAAIQEHPDVRSVAVIGLPDDDLGHIVHAVIEADQDTVSRRSALLRRRTSGPLQGPPLNRVHRSAAPRRSRQTPPRRAPCRADRDRGT